MSIPTHCDAGCSQAFTIESFKLDLLPDEIEKIYFTCTHCGHEYLAYYTDAEIRKLQESLRGIQVTSSYGIFIKYYDHVAAAKREAKIQKQIKEKMDELKQRMESL